MYYDSIRLSKHEDCCEFSLHNVSSVISHKLDMQSELLPVSINCSVWDMKDIQA